MNIDVKPLPPATLWWICRRSTCRRDRCRADGQRHRHVCALRRARCDHGGRRPAALERAMATIGATGPPRSTATNRRGGQAEARPHPPQLGLRRHGRGRPGGRGRDREGRCQARHLRAADAATGNACMGGLEHLVDFDHRMGAATICRKSSSTSPYEPGAGDETGGDHRGIADR